MQLSKDQIKQLLILLNRVMIKGEEVPAFVELLNTLNALLAEKPE